MVKTLMITAQYPITKRYLNVSGKLSPFWLAFILSEYAIQGALGVKSQPWSYTLLETECYKHCLASQDLPTVAMVAQLL